MFQKEKFGMRLRALRKAKGESQTVLADLLDVSVAHISEMESGKKTTSLERLYLLCDHFQVSADYLLGLKDEMTEIG